ncbi:YidH family protein [Virgibacillus byunsanensis]|uniref:YidH family protein n=1 Tax=Virgibacillus byunsanensis TaxID=570945 RepID=A0ABW3LS61_9BACI
MKNENDESKYVTQHLANERTYLAWVRTALAIIGIGFLATTLHFNTPMNEHVNNSLIVLISLFTLLFGLITISFSTLIYIRNRRNINTQSFHSSFKLIIFMTCVICLVLFLVSIYSLFVIKQ